MKVFDHSISVESNSFLVLHSSFCLVFVEWFSFIYCRVQGIYLYCWTQMYEELIEYLPRANIICTSQIFFCSWYTMDIMTYCAWHTVDIKCCIINKNNMKNKLPKFENLSNWLSVDWVRFVFSCPVSPMNRYHIISPTAIERNLKTSSL